MCISLQNQIDSDQFALGVFCVFAGSITSAQTLIMEGVPKAQWKCNTQHDVVDPFYFKGLMITKVNRCLKYLLFMFRKHQARLSVNKT